MTHLYNKTEVKKAASTEKEYAFGGSHHLVEAARQERERV
jgi:hypothetical protein